MKLKTLLYALGLKKTPKYSARFAANHPVNGTFFHVQFSDGKSGMVCDRRDGTFIPQVKLIPKDSRTTFVTFDDAAQALYRGVTENGDPWKNRK